MTVNMSILPIEPQLKKICEVLADQRRAILVAPPGAGKTTRVPLALAGLIKGFKPYPGKIIMLEPRRIAARLAAERMAATLGEAVGKHIGLSTRIERRISDQTCVEVMTEGVFIRRILADPELSGVSVVIFDEIHERSLNVDLALSLSLEVQSALREDLNLLAMSATLEAESLARRLQAPVITSTGRAFPVETRYLGRTRDPISDQMMKAIERAVTQTEGSILAFLPGAADIRRVAERLDLNGPFQVAPLYGALSPQEQDLAIAPSPNGVRKIVLATDIAESSLTIEGVSVVVDSGLARQPRYDPAGLTTQLQTVRASLANVDQRRGRAGRLGPGICYRLWDEPETRGLNRAPEPEISRTDLSGLVLNLAEWGERNPLNLTWLSPPPVGRIEAAQQQLIELGALDPDLSLTEKGQRMAKLPLNPALAALVVSAATPQARALAARLALLISERSVGGTSPDLSTRLQQFERDRSPRASRLRRQAAQWSDGATPKGDVAEILARGWPHRLARRREPGSLTYLLASGQAGQLSEGSALAKSEWLVVADLMGGAKGARIVLAAALTETTAKKWGKISTEEQVEFLPKSQKLRARKIVRLGAISLSEQPLPKPKTEAANEALLNYLRQEGFSALGLSAVITGFLSRLGHMKNVDGESWPTYSVGGLQQNVASWLGPALNESTFSIPTPKQCVRALSASLEWPYSRDIDVKAPLTLTLPSGRRAQIDWCDERAPLVACKVQEVYGQTAPIAVAEGRLPVTLQFLSPGGKPVATTRDVPQFWQKGYHDMAKDMRGRYPKHDWPEDPARARPHLGLTKARLARSKSTNS